MANNKKKKKGGRANKGAVGALANGQGLNSDSAQAEASSQLGQVAYQQGDLVRAAPHFIRAVQLKPTDPVLALNAGVTLYGQGHYPESIPYFQQALALQSDFAEAHFNLANALVSCGRQEEGVLSYQNALTYKPGFPAALNNLAATLNALGLAQYEGGRLPEAVATLEQALAITPNDLGALNNLGLTYNGMQLPAQAIACYRRGLGLHPQHPQLLYNLGNALACLGKLPEAAAAYRQALGIQPDYTEAMNNLASACQDLGIPAEAELLFQKIIALKPSQADAYANLGGLMLAQGRNWEALSCCRQAIALNPHNRDHWQQMVMCLQQVRVEANEIAAIEIDLLRCLAMDGIYRDPLVALAIDILKQKPFFGEVLRMVRDNGGRVDGGGGYVLELLQSDLLLHLLPTAVITDPELEAVLTGIRRLLLLGPCQEWGQPEILLNFGAALAQQCFANEYVFFQTKEENDAVLALVQGLEDSLASAEALDPYQVVVAAAYGPLRQLTGGEQLPASQGLPSSLQKIVVSQVVEPRQEDALRATIQSLFTIDDRVSQEVRLHYEQNPYPRWQDLPLTGAPGAFAAQLRTKLPALSLEGLTLSTTPEILVAGCGTGREALQSSKIYRGAKILAVDLSLSSLAYAKRKALQYQAENIEFFQSDILALCDLERRFDLIECSGVLHHMQDPLAGWKVLLGLLKPQGFMKVALYSELARQPVVAARELIARQGYLPTTEGIRECRRDILRLSAADPARQVFKSRDFYTTSECRDLIFHGMEHRFTIPRLREIFDDLEVIFLGFTFNDPAIRADYQCLFPDDEKCLSLEHWQQYEQQKPETFAGMYTFWLRKA